MKALTALTPHDNSSNGDNEMDTTADSARSQASARGEARRDFSQNRAPRPQHYYAMPGSQWEAWYLDEYRRLGLSAVRGRR